MSRPLALVRLLLISTALVAPVNAWAQTAPGPTGPQTPPTAPVGSAAPAEAPQAEPAPEEPEVAPEVSVPGGNDQIVVVGRRNSNITRTSPQVVSVLSSEDIARTGEGDIAGALSRVTGLSVVTGGFVYVRGLGDRYSLALLNGSPLPSPEPLRRVVPLDVFPASVIASSYVQKTYSANFPGEFGGGVINLTTKSVPKDGFLTVSSSISGNTATTGQLGYTYFGSASDWTGFDNGQRNLPAPLQNFLNSGDRISAGDVNTQAIASQLVDGRNGIVQRNTALPPNFSGTVTGGKSWELDGDATIGVIATVGFSNKWQTRDTLQQTASTQDLSLRELDFQRVITDNRIVVDGLIGASLDFGDNKVRWTTLYIRDTLKQARLGVGTRATTSTTATLLQQDTAWFERQLIDTQLVGEFKLTDKLSLDVRGSYANSRREAPNELSFEYFRSNAASDPFGGQFINNLNNGLSGSAGTAYSFLRENLFSFSWDLSYKLKPGLIASIGYAYQDTFRTTERREFLFLARNLPQGAGLLRPDLLLQPALIRAFNINLVDTNEGNPVFGSTLVTQAAYARLQAQITNDLNIDIGVRFESGAQSVRSVQVFRVAAVSAANTNINRDYFLPTATLTYQLTPEMQLRLSGSQTIARPQFRELIFQNYFDPDNNRLYRGNPLLEDSQLLNAEARYEWYFARDQRIAVAGFYKKIDKPIEAFVAFSDNAVLGSFANAPSADLYGGEIEVQRFIPLDDLFGGSKFFASRRAVLIANYTFTKSAINVSADDPARVFASGATRASDFFRNGAPLTGQSDHLANLEIGLEDTSNLSQQTFLLSYASQRASLRGGAGQPDVFELPGFRLDFVARQGIKFLKVPVELKFEIRNITGTIFQEFQENGPNRIFYNRYVLGTTAALGLSLNF